MKKVLSLLLAVVMIVTIVPVSAIMASAKIYSGTCGETVNWSYNSDTTKLTITGNGDMFDYTSNNASPWSSFASSITVTEINDGITNIGAFSFNNCVKISYIRIPESVVSIGNSAFQGCSGLTNITIPESVTTIGNSAFYSCSGLTSVTIPDSVTSVGGYAFSGCSGLSSATIGNSVTSIGGYAFCNCSGLTSVTIPDSVTSIGEWAFYYCSSLINLVVPDSVTNIGEHAFAYCSALTSVAIGKSVTSIGDFAFSECKSIKELTIPDSAKINSVNDFRSCSKIEKVTITKGMGSMQHYYLAWSNSRSNLEEVIIEDGVTSISNDAFFGCSKLTSITIPDSVTNIGDSAFYSCSSLKSITIPDSVTCIGEKAFYNTNFYKDSDNWKNGALYIGKNLICVSNNVEGIYTIKPKTIMIADSAFSDCSNISKIIFPDTVRNIGRSAFNGCDNLVELVIPNNVEYVGINALNGCSNINDLVLPCSLDFNDRILTDSTTIENIKLVSGTGVIPDYTISTYKNTPWFKSKNSLRELIIDEGVTKIGAYSFYNNSITEITIPKTVTEIGDNAFGECDSLSTVYFTGTQEEWNAIIFNEDNDYLTSASVVYNYVVPCKSHTKVVVSAAVEPTCSSFGYTEESYCSVCNYVISTRAEIPKLEHTAVIDSAKAATCTTTGLTEGTHCFVCGEIIVAQEVVNAKGHTYARNTVAPTCKEQGYTVYTCENCGDSYKADFTAVSSNHDYKEAVTQLATCSQKGVQTFTCSICGDKYTETIPMTSHTTVVDAAVAPTCTKAGLAEGSHCEVCGYVIKEQAVVPANGHDYKTTITAPTCKEQGYTIHTCTVCGDSYKDTFTETTTIHDYKATVTTPATCSQKGVKTFTCSICGDKYTEEIPMTEHTAVIDKAVEATCTKSGLTAGSHCSVCGYVIVKQEVVEMKEHTVANDSAVEPTCTKAGLTAGTHCSVCGKVLTAQTAVVAKGHNYNAVVTVPTCKDKGYTTHTCTVCGDSYKDTLTNTTTNHNYKATVTTPATCTKTGVKTFTCSICGDKYTESIPMVAHNNVTDAAVAATCTKTGLTEGTHCSVCGTVGIAQNTVAKKAHNYASVVTSDSTCSQTGVKTFTCTVCGDKYTQSIALKEHTIVADNAVAPTCTKYGLDGGSHCSTCGKVFDTQERIEPLGHDFGDFVTPATLTANGVITHPCSRCEKADASEVIYAPKTFALAKTTYVYTGKAIAPAVTVKDSNGKALVKGTDYTVAYKNNINVGTASVVVTFTGNYEGTKTLTFTILPKATNVSLTAAKKAFTAKWGKVAGVTGYQLQYATNAKFTKATTKAIKGATKYSLKVANLKGGTKYFVRVRTYKTIGGKNYYSAWSGAKAVITKK